MNALSFLSLLSYAIILICYASASCPCHIPCNNEEVTCTCYGTCGDDGYGCKRNGDDYDFLSQIQCREGQWQVQCLRTAKCSIKDTIDDTNPFASYEQTVNNLMIESFDEEDDTTSSAAASYSWFGGNWFDFWAQNSQQFFAVDDVDNNNQNSANMKKKYKQYDDITIDQPGFGASQSTQRTLQNVKSSHSNVLDDLGQNEAGYKIIALPLYILIICIIVSAILGMLMCAGFVYCGLNCCCPLPPSSPILSAQQRVDMTRVLQSLTLGASAAADKSYDTDRDNDGYSVYHRMRNALHNPTNDDESSILSNEVDEYQDSEDDFKEDAVTRGNLTDDDGYERKEPFALYGKCESDIDQDSDDSMIEKLSNLIETQVFDSRSYKDIDIDEEEEEKDIIEERTPTQNDTIAQDMHQNIEEVIFVNHDHEQHEIELQIDEQQEESGDEEYNDDDNVIDYTDIEGISLLRNNNNINDSGDNHGAKSSALP